MGRRLLNRLALTASVAAVTLAAGASPAGAITIGQTGVSNAHCDKGDWAQPPVSDGTPYAVPSTGGIVNWTLTSWSHYANPDSGQQLKVKVYRQVGGLDYTVVGQDGPRNLTGGALNTFPANIAVKPGDVLGMTTFTPFGVGCGLPPATETFYFSDSTDQPNGAPVTFAAFSPSGRLNVSAVVQPTNTFTLGATTRKKKKGTATISLDLPNPGELTGSGKGVKTSSAGRAVISKSVGAGQARLLIKAKGKKKRKLNETGRVKLNVAITYMPTGGDPSTQSVKVKLKKKL
jgi:hypothetical protein